MFRRAAAIGTVAALALLAAPAPASAATYAASGHRCTMVGTMGPDRLVGTGGRDVICGLGGDDVILGRGGNDVIDGGTGADRLFAGAGKDNVRGGNGADRLLGGSEDDLLNGGSGADRVEGEDGADRVYGGNGQDRLIGGAGADRLAGGDDEDTLKGGAGGDVILGQGGDDDLDGQAGPDALDGGADTNWCTIGSTDTSKACVYDKAPPTVGAVSLPRAVIDSSGEHQVAKVRVRVKDDTGVSRVFVNTHTVGDSDQIGGPNFGYASLVSGDSRDGVWEAGAGVGVYDSPGTWGFDVSVQDRVGRSAHSSADSPTLTVVNRNADAVAPVLVSFSLDRNKVDVRSASATIAAVVHVTDNRAGVAGGTVCPWPVGHYGEWLCGHLERYKGTERDGWWRTTFTIPKGSGGGDWNAVVNVHDWGNGAASYNDLADGRITVIGVTDNTPAEAVGLKIDHTSIDTLGTAQTVRVSMHVTDAPGEGVIAASIYVRDEAGEVVIPQEENAVLTSGTAVDGWWSSDLTFAQGTPPGRYRVEHLLVSDRGHFREYALPGSRHDGDEGVVTLPAAAIVGPEGQPWDGVITVVANPSG